MGKRIRILLADAGPETGGRETKSLALALRDAGCEVIYAGMETRPEAVAGVAMQEDANAIGLFGVTGETASIFQAVLLLLAREGVSGVLVFGGGELPEESIRNLLAMGVKAFFAKSAPASETVRFLTESLSSVRGE